MLLILHPYVGCHSNICRVSFVLVIFRSSFCGSWPLLASHPKSSIKHVFLIFSRSLYLRITVVRYIISVCSLSPCGRAFTLRLIFKRKCFRFVIEKCKRVHIFSNLILSCSTCSVCQCKIKKFLYKTCFLLHCQYRSFNPCKQVSILRLIIGKENISGFRKELKVRILKKNFYLNLSCIRVR